MGGGGFGGIGGGRGGPGGGFGGGGGRGGMGGTGRKYSLNFSAQALNLFNDVDYGTPVGSLTQACPIVTSSCPSTATPSSRFDRSKTLAGGIFNCRRVIAAHLHSSGVPVSRIVGSPLPCAKAARRRPDDVNFFIAGVREKEMKARTSKTALFLSPLFVALLTVSMHAQTAAPAPSREIGAATVQTASATQGILRGHVIDPTGALIPGTSISVTTATGTAAGMATSDAAGGYVVRGLAADSYIVQATSEGFALFVSTPVSLGAGESKTFDIKMTLGGTEQQVEVTAEGAPQISTDASDNASSEVIQGKNIEALSDDPDELSNELSALAGPSAGPNGGQMYIDGFTGGTLPPKSAIREIRINSNPFSAEFDWLGYGRVEILTKPGTDKFRGRAFIQGNDNAFNTGNPFTGSATLPSYHSIQYNGTVSGAMSKWASYFFSIEDRNNQDDSVYTANTAVLSGGTYVPGTVSGGFFSPSSHFEVSPRVDLQLGQKNTLTVRYQYARMHSTNLNGSTSLPTLATTSSTIEHAIQISDSEVINQHIVNETRFQWRYAPSLQNPASTLPQVSVPGSFAGGGSTGQTQNSIGQHFELQNFVTMTAGAHAIKFGLLVRDNRQASISHALFNGSFSFPSVAAYIATLNGWVCRQRRLLQQLPPIAHRRRSGRLPAQQADLRHASQVRRVLPRARFRQIFLTRRFSSRTTGKSIAF